MSKAILKLLTLQKRQRATIENFDRSCGSVLKSSYELRRKPRPIIKVLRYGSGNETNAMCVHCIVPFRGGKEM